MINDQEFYKNVQLKGLKAIKESQIKKSILKRKVRVEERIQSIASGVIDPNYPAYCTHPLIGSSNFRRFIRENYMLKRIHVRSSTLGAAATGRYWEEVTSTRRYFKVDKTKYTFEPLREQPFSTSKVFPFICCQTDFIAQLTNYIRKEIIIIEVKSTTKESTYANFFEKDDTNEVYQVKVALDIFNIQRAALVAYLVDQNGSLIETNSRWIYNDKVLLANNDKIISNYATYLTSLAIFPIASQKSLAFKKKPTIGYEENLEAFKEYSTAVVKSIVYYSKAAKSFVRAPYQIVTEARDRVKKCKINHLIGKYCFDHKRRVGRPRFRRTGPTPIDCGIKNLTIKGEMIIQSDDESEKAPARPVGRPKKIKKIAPIRWHNVKKSENNELNETYSIASNNEVDFNNQHAIKKKSLPQKQAIKQSNKGSKKVTMAKAYIHQRALNSNELELLEKIRRKQQKSQAQGKSK